MNSASIDVVDNMEKRSQEISLDPSLSPDMAGSVYGRRRAR